MAVHSEIMRKSKRVSRAVPRTADGVSVRVRFASHEQLDLIRNAAAKRGIARDLFIQRVLQAAAQAVMVLPPDPVIERIGQDAASQA
jgi:hypothetical protein